MSRIAELGARLQSGEKSYDIVGSRNRQFLISIVLVVLSFAGLGIRHLDLGIEFKGGAVFQAQAQGVAVSQFRDAAVKAGAKDPVVQTIGTNKVQVVTGALNSDQATAVRHSVANTAGIPDEEVTDQLVGPSWGSDISRQALKGLLVFLVLLAIYLAMVFEWKLALCALISLIQKVIITIGIYAIVGFAVTPASLIGLLTTLGYSLYDVVVVFDKLKENTANLTNSNKYTYSGAANLAINQTLFRSINTTVIALLPVAGLLFVGAGLWGAGTLKDLALVLFVGIAVGAYSSIFIAAPLAAALKEREPAMQALAKRVAAHNAARRATAAATGTGAVVEQLTPAAAALRDGVAPDQRVQPRRGGPRSMRRPGKKT
jgi:preprotein translocase subunit SecF